METTRPTKKIIFGLTIVAVFFLTIIIVFILLKNRTYLQKEKVSPTPIVQSSIPTQPALERKKIGRIALSTMRQVVSLTKKEKIVVLTRVDSGGRDVVGFDLIFKFNKKDLNLSKVGLTSANFDLFKRTFSGGEIITGAKKISQKNKIVLNNNQLIKLTFVPKKEGRYNISVISTDNVNKTQFVDSQTKIIYPEVSSLSITVDRWFFDGGKNRLTVNLRFVMIDTPYDEKLK